MVVLRRTVMRRLFPLATLGATAPGAARGPLTEEQEAELAQRLERQPVLGYIQKRKDKQMEEHKASGIWVTDERRAELERERKDRAREVAEADAAHGGGATIDYPTEDINPDDIPF